MTATMTFIEDDDTLYQADARIGRSVVQAAIRNSVPGIVADGGGAGICATCHAYGGADWMPTVASSLSQKNRVENIFGFYRFSYF